MTYAHSRALHAFHFTNITKIYIEVICLYKCAVAWMYHIIFFMFWWPGLKSSEKHMDSPTKFLGQIDIGYKIQLTTVLKIWLRPLNKISVNDILLNDIKEYRICWIRPKCNSPQYILYRGFVAQLYFAENVCYTVHSVCVLFTGALTRLKKKVPMPLGSIIYILSTWSIKSI